MEPQTAGARRHGEPLENHSGASAAHLVFLLLFFLFLFSLVVVVNDSAKIQSLPEGSAFLLGCCRQASLERAIASHQYFSQASAGTGSIGNYFHFTEYIKIFLRKKRQVSGDLKWRPGQMTVEINLISPPRTELLHVVVVRTLHLPLVSAALYLLPAGRAASVPELLQVVCHFC